MIRWAVIDTNMHGYSTNLQMSGTCLTVWGLFPYFPNNLT